MHEAIAAQRRFFALLDDFFRSATGKTPQDFAKLDGFQEALKADIPRIAPLSEQAFGRFGPELIRFYKEHMTTLIEFARVQGGVKVVLGSGRFGKTQLNAVRKLLLYADVVLIPDPILPWIETPREEEKFVHVEILQAVFFLLRLRPLVDTDFGYPPVLVFQSWERSLVQRDLRTREFVDNFLTNVLSVSLGVRLANVSEIFQYATKSEQQFLRQVAEKGLFIAPGGAVGEPLAVAIDRYRADLRRWRTEQHVKQLESLSDGQFVLNGILERLEPQYHLVENANELRAQPLLAIQAQAHYFSMCANSIDDLLVQNEIVTPATRASVLALGDQQFERLGNVPIDALVEMRLKNENEQFRAELAKAIELLGDVSLSDLDRVAAEVTREIGSLLNKHRTEARRINEKYQNKYRALAAVGMLTLVGFAIPSLTPLLGTVAPLLIAQQYTQAKLAERYEKRQLSRSLVGILAGAEAASDEPE